MRQEQQKNLSGHHQIEALSDVCHQLANTCHDFANTFLSYQAEIESLLETTDQEINSSGYLIHSKRELKKIVNCFMEQLSTFNSYIIK